MFAADDTYVDKMVVPTVVYVVAKEDVVEGDMVITHKNSPAGTGHLWHKLMYTLQTNGDSSPCNKRIILRKRKYVRDGDDLMFH